MAEQALLPLELKDNLKTIYDKIDPPPPAKTTCEKAVAVLVNGVNLGLVFSLPFAEIQWTESLSWGYTVTEYGVVRFYGLVLIFSAILPVLLTQFYLAFFVVGMGRRRYGYKLPVMYASVDMHVADVAAGGSILSQGNAEYAEQQLKLAVNYSCHQRTHNNALESLPLFFVLSLLGGLRYPLSTAFYGFYWCVARVIWTKGYTTGTPIDRYGNPFGSSIWACLLGVIVTTMGLAIDLLR